MAYVLQRKDHTSIVCPQVMSKRLSYALKIKLIQMTVAVSTIVTGILILLLV